MNVTLFIPLCGRVDIWQKHLSQFLENQYWVHSSVKLILCDTSNDQEFGRILKQWLSQCDYPHNEYVAFPNTKPTDDLSLSNLCCDIYNVAAEAATTEYTWIVEDDVIPPLNAAIRLISNFNDLVGSCSGVYHFKNNPALYMAWLDDTYHLIPKDSEKIDSSGTQLVRGTGFGCVMIRSSELYGYKFPHFDKLIPSFDHTFFDRMTLRKILDWSVVCQHLGMREW